MKEMIEKAEQRNTLIEQQMLHECESIRQLVAPSADEPANKVTSVNQKMVDLLKFKIESKKQISELQFKTERLQRINRKITDENEQLLNRMTWQERTLSDKDSKIEVLEQELDQSIYDIKRPKTLKKGRKSVKSKSNSKTRNPVILNQKRSGSYISDKSRQSRCLSGSKKSVRSRSSKKRGTSIASGKKRSVSYGVRSHNSSKVNEEKAKHQEVVQKFEQEIFNMREQYA
jgi:hypothetical protein